MVLSYIWNISTDKLNCAAIVADFTFMFFGTIGIYHSKSNRIDPSSKFALFVQELNMPKQKDISPFSSCILSLFLFFGGRGGVVMYCNFYLLSWYFSSLRFKFYSIIMLISSAFYFVLYCYTFSAGFKHWVVHCFKTKQTTFKINKKYVTGWG